MPEQQEALIPPLRCDIAIHRAPAHESGVPAYMVHDPLHGTFERADWFQAQVLLRMDRPQTVADLLARLLNETTIRTTPEDLTAFCADAVQRGLTRASNTKPVGQLLQEMKARQLSAWQWLAHHYLYFRIPLLHPDAFLERTLPWVSWLVSPVTIGVWSAFALAGLWLLLQHLQEYIHTFPHFFHWQGALVYGFALVFSKTVHEFSHAYTAKACGTRVPRMGIAFMVMWPIPFCDVTDSWRMRDRRRRLLISSAGILSELAIAGLALFLWGVAPPGILRSIGFVLSSVTVVSTLLVNLNPAMRFDGYYIFSDLLGVDNLQARAFAVTRYYLRTAIFGLSMPFPEPDLPVRRRAIMVAYSVYAWLYRLFLYLSIAVLVYCAFTKVVGVVLFLVEILFFIVQPLLREASLLLRNHDKIRYRWRPAALAVALAAAILWLTLPLPRQEHIPATTVPGRQQLVLAPDEGLLEKLHTIRGKIVSKGDLIALIRNPELDHQIDACRARIATIQSEIDKLQGSRENVGEIGCRQEELGEAEAQLAGLLNRRTQNRITADLNGVVVQTDEALTPGSYIQSRQLIARIAAPASVAIRAYLPEHLAGQLVVGDKIQFREHSTLDSSNGQIISISPIRSSSIPYAELTSEYGGPIAVKHLAQHQVELVDAWYEVQAILQPSDNTVRLRQSGELIFRTRPRSLLAEGLAYIRRVLLRESNV